MSNPLFKLLGGQQAQPPLSGPFARFGSAMNAVKQFRDFRTNFRGDPRQEIQRLLDSGQMTQQQFNQLHGLAQQFISMFKL